MKTSEEQNKVENSEVPKISSETVEEKEISPDEFLDFANKEEQKFKQESDEQIDKLNSVDIDPETFEKLKDETSIENDLNNINKELEEIITQAKMSSTRISVLKVIPDTFNYFVDNLDGMGHIKNSNDPKLVEAKKQITKIQEANKEISESQKIVKKKHYKMQ